MSETTFSLVAFPAASIPAVTVSGKIAFHENVLAIEYLLTGDTGSLSLPQVVIDPSRKDELWKNTCFEFFLAVREQPAYWECNVSPSGNWNFYRMDGYRRVGFREEASIQSLQREIHRESGAVRLKVVVDLTPLLPGDHQVQLGIAAVLQTNAGNETYWALVHAAPQADFHRRESFIVPLEARTHPARQSVPDD